MPYIIQEKDLPKKLYQDPVKDRKNLNMNAIDRIVNGSSSHNKMKLMPIFLKLFLNLKVK